MAKHLWTPEQARAASKKGLLVRWSLPSRPTLEERFWSKVDKSGGIEACWWWTSTRNEDGYGHFGIGKKCEKAHRVAWWLVNSPIPEGMQVLHRCDSPSCVNPKHLFLGYNSDNVADKVAKGRQAKGDAIALKLQGEKGGRAKLTEPIVLAIRKEWRSKRTPQDMLARRYGVTQSLISHIVRRKTWTHI